MLQLIECYQNMSVKEEIVELVENNPMIGLAEAVPYMSLIVHV